MMDGFYEDDEPVEHVAVEFERGERVMTRAPTGWRCEHMAVAFGHVRMPVPPVCGGGCEMQPILT